MYFHHLTNSSISCFHIVRRDALLSYKISTLRHPRIEVKMNSKRAQNCPSSRYGVGRPHSYDKLLLQFKYSFGRTVPVPRPKPPLSSPKVRFLQANGDIY